MTALGNEALLISSSYQSNREENAYTTYICQRGWKEEKRNLHTGRKGTGEDTLFKCDLKVNGYK